MLDERSLQVSIRWLYDNRHAGYWTYPILLSDDVSPKVKALNLTHDEALAVFLTCEELGFLKKLEGELLLVKGVGYTKYRVNYAKLQEYYEFAHPPFYHRIFPDSWVYWLKKYKGLFLVVFTVIGTTILIESGKDIYELLTGWTKSLCGH